MFGIPMSREDHGFIGKRTDPSKAVIHVFGIASRKVGSSTTVEEEGVPRDECTVKVEALAARSVSGGVEEIDVEIPDLHNVSAFVRHHLAH